MMTLTVSNLTLTAPSAATASSNQLILDKPQLTITFGNIDADVLNNQPNDKRCLSMLAHAYPELFSGLAYKNVTFDGSLRMSYIGKGSIRALLRSMLNQSHAMYEKQLFDMSNENLAHIQALLASPILQPNVNASHSITAPASTLAMPSTSHSTDTPLLSESMSATTALQSRPTYLPLNHRSMSSSVNGVAKQTILHKDNSRRVYAVASGIGARRSHSDLIASISWLANLLSHGLSPRSTVFQDSHGNRCAVGSDFNPNAATLYQHLESMTHEERKAFITSHAKNLGECIALMIYLDQTDFHTLNIMYDFVKNRLFIIDFDRCYNKGTHKYRNFFRIDESDFALISQRDLRSPLNPIDRVTVNWFTRSQAKINNRSIHTLEKLSQLPELDSVIASADFNLGYFSCLYACSRLESEHIYPCTGQIANPRLRQQMVDDFSARSRQLCRQLLSMPEFIECYQHHSDIFNAYLTELQVGGISSPKPLTAEQLNAESCSAMNSKVVEIQAFADSFDEALKKLCIPFTQAIHDNNQLNEKLATLRKNAQALEEQKNIIINDESIKRITAIADMPIHKSTPTATKNHIHLCRLDKKKHATKINNILLALEDNVKECKTREKEQINIRRTIAELKYQLNRSYLMATREIEGIDKLIQYAERQKTFFVTFLDELMWAKKIICQALNHCTLLINEHNGGNHLSLSADIMPCDYLLDTPIILNDTKKPREFVEASNGFLIRLTNTINDFPTTLWSKNNNQTSISDLIESLIAEANKLIPVWHNSFNEFKTLETSQHPELIRLSHLFTSLSAQYIGLISRLLGIIKETEPFRAPEARRGTPIKEMIRKYRDFYFEKGKEHLNLVITLLKTFLDANVISSIDYSKAQSQCLTEIAQLSQRKNNLQCHLGEMEDIRIDFSAICSRLRHVTPESYTHLSAMDIYSIIMAGAKILQNIIERLQKHQIYSAHEMQEHGRLLCVYAEKQRLPLPFRAHWLVFVDNLCNHMENYPIVIPNLPNRTTMSNIKDYSERYRQSRSDVNRYSCFIAQLYSFLEQLYDFGLITIDYYHAQQERLALLRLTNEKLQHILRTNDAAAQSNLDKFSITYHQATQWYAGISHDKRPNYIETQYQCMNADTGTWEKWQQICALGRHAASNPSWTTQVVSFFYKTTRDARTQAFYDSFPEDTSAAWQPPR